ncbi:hypothetical protein Tco_0980158 [Tanacetum coccineum]
MQSKEGKVNSSKALYVGLVVTESNKTESERHVLSSRSGNDTHTDDADINSVNDKQPMAEVQLSAEHNILANEQQHSEQSESVYDTYLLEKVDRNTTPESTDMSHRGGEIDQNADAKKCQVSCPLPDPSFDNMTTEFSNQFLESENISLKKTVAQLQKDFSRMETHCVNMELKYQNQALKDGQHGQILNETINIELEHSVAKLLAENEMLHKENEQLKQTYKDLYDSIKKTRVQTNNLNDSLVAQVNSKTIENVNLKAQIQEKVFANVALKNELRKLKGNSVDTKESVFAKPQHVIAPGSSRNSSKESYGSNDMAHNYYLEEAKKKTQDKNRNLKPRKMPSAKTHNTPNACTPKPRSNNQTSRNWPASKSCEETLKAMQKTDHSRNPSSFSDFKHFIQPNKTRNSNKPVDPTSHTQKPGRKIVTGHSFSLNKSSVVHEKINTPRSYLRWIPTVIIFNIVGLKWVPTGKTFTSSTTKVDCELPNGSNDYITNPYKCDQTLNVSADQHPCFMIMASVDNTSGPVPQRKERCTLQCALSSKEKKSSFICVLRISGLYTLRLLDAACKKVLNLLKKGLLKVEAILKRARVMIKAIDKKLKDRRLMRSLEKFVGGRPYRGDLRKLKDGGKVKEFQRSLCHSDIKCLSRSDEVLKLKNFKKDATLKLFKSTNQERYEHVGPKSQVHKMEKSQDGKTRLCLVDDLKVFKITISLTSQDKGTCSCLKSKDTTTYSQDKRHEVYELKTKDKA